MIFATVGTQLPFPRLVGALDRIARAHQLDIVAQTNDSAARPRHLRHHAHLTPADFQAYAETAALLVGHAGMGTVLTAKKLRKPLVIFPRLALLGEHRNEHQRATARSLEGTRGIYVAWDEAALEALLTRRALEAASPEPGPTRQRLIDRIRSFIEG